MRGAKRESELYMRRKIVDSETTKTQNKQGYGGKSGFRKGTDWGKKQGDKGDHKTHPDSQKF